MNAFIFVLTTAATETIRKQENEATAHRLSQQDTVSALTYGMQIRT